MNIDRLRLIALLFLLGAAAYLYMPPIGDITGRATSAFSAGATVVPIEFDTGNPAQQSPVIVSGPRVNISINITYHGGAVVNVTVRKPRGYEGGIEWHVIEDGREKTATDAGENIRWEADPSAVSAELHFAALPPFHEVEFTYETPTQFTEQVRIGSEVHFTNVSASIPLVSRYEHHRLYEVGETEMDRTEEYNFTVNATHASWYGFNLSTKRFRIAATKNAGQLPGGNSGGGGGGGGAGGGSSGGGTRTVTVQTNKTVERIVLPQPKPQDNFVVAPGWIDIALEEGASAEANITVLNRGIAAQRFTLESTVAFLSAPQEVDVPANTSAMITVKAGPTPSGDWQGRIIVSNGTAEQYAFFSLRTTSPPGASPPMLEQPSMPQKQRGSILTDLLFFGFLLLVIAGIYLYATAGRRSEQQ